MAPSVGVTAGAMAAVMVGAEAEAIYNCIAADLAAGYRAGDKRWFPAEFVAVGDAGELQKGPLFLMQKVAAGASPETGDCCYMMVTRDERLRRSTS